MIILPTHEHGMCFHLLYHLQFLSSVSYNFPTIVLLHPWLNLFLGIFNEIVNEVVFLVSLSDSLLLVSINTSNIFFIQVL